MRKEAKRAINQMTPPGKLDAIRALLDSFGTAYIVALELEPGTYAGQYSKCTTEAHFYQMIGGMIVLAAKRNAMTPIKLLSMIGEEVSRLMENEKSERIKVADKASPKATKPAKRS